MYRKETEGRLKHFDFILLDLICLQAAFVLAYIASGNGLKPYFYMLYRNMAFFLALADLIVLFSMDTLKGVLKHGYYVEFIVTARHVVVLFGLSLLYLFVLQQGVNYSRAALFMTFAFYAIFTYVTRMIWKKALRKKKAAGGERSLLIVTASDIAETVIENIKENNYAGYTIAGAVLMDESAASVAGEAAAGGELSSVEAKTVDTELSSDSAKAGGAEISRVGIKAAYSAHSSVEPSQAGVKVAESKPLVVATGKGKKRRFQKGTEIPAWEEAAATRIERTISDIPIVADGDSAAMYVCREWIDEVIVVPSDNMEFPQKLLDEFQETGVTVHLNLARINNVPGKKQFVERVGGYTVLTSSINYASARQMLLKRVMDIAAGLVGCLCTGVIFLFVAPAIKITSPGPVFFSQERVGQNGKKFRMYKFRSMYIDAEERKKDLMKDNKMSDDKMFKLDFDPRVIGNKILPDGTKKTGLGQFLRDSSLDEFPQFFNVLKGDMSLVGTRPPLVGEVSEYELHHRARLAFKPGITGLWQVSGRSDITDFEEVVRLDRQYISEWNLMLDIKILFKTVWVVLRRKGSS